MHLRHRLGTSCTAMTDAEKLEELYRELRAIERKRSRCKTELEYAALLIDHRALEEEIWELDKSLEDY